MRRALFLAALLAGCGVKAPPRPPEPERPQTTSSRGSSRAPAALALGTPRPPALAPAHPRPAAPKLEGQPRPDPSAER